MNEEELLKKVTLEYIAEPYKSYAGAIGINNLYNLAKLKGGKYIYIPKPERLFKEYIYSQVVNEYKTSKTTMRMLAQKYEISVHTVNDLIQKHY